MVTRIVAYRCEVCQQTYRLKREAERCESRKPGRLWPQGLIFGMPQSTRSHHETNLLFVVKEAYVSKHFTEVAAWAFRNNGAGDSIDKECCGAAPNGPYTGGPDPAHSTFERAVAYLAKHNIPAQVWDGKKVRTLAAYRKAWANGRVHTGAKA